MVLIYQFTVKLKGMTPIKKCCKEPYASSSVLVITFVAIVVPLAHGYKMGRIYRAS